MRNDSLSQFVNLRRQLAEERSQLEDRLRQINEALGEMPLPSLSQIQGATGTAPSQGLRRGRRSAGGQSLREHVIAVLQSGSKTKEEILAAIKGRGYRFSTSNPLNSLGVILYGKKPKFDRADGRFSLRGGQTRAGVTAADRSSGGRRTMSAAARARIAAAQKARWARQKGGRPQAQGAPNGGATQPRRRMSAAGRKAIAEAARRRWAAAKAAGRTKL